MKASNSQLLSVFDIKLENCKKDRSHSSYSENYPEVTDNQRSMNFVNH